MKFHSKLHKRHKALSFRRVQESIAADFIRFHHVRSEDNPADILNKHWSYNCVWKLMRSILFWRGDTALVPNNDAVINKDEDSQT